MSKFTQLDDASHAECPEVSVVMPCLNEADTLAICIEKARSSMSHHGIEGEVIVADNGSSDGSQAIGATHGARIVTVPGPGYGSALMGGIAAAKGSYVVMGDADDSYDFSEVPRFVETLRGGYDLVQGCRLPAGGGRISPGAMPWLHEWWGNPMLSLIARWWFRAPIHDVYCGLRGFRRDLIQKLDLRCTGMEFAPEMVVKATMNGARITEIPITLHVDGRRSHAPHLRTFRDGWRTLRFFLMYSPRWLFLVPGALLMALALAGYAVALPGLSFGGVRFDAHTLLFASLAAICGYQAILFAVLTKTFAITEGLLPADARMDRLFRVVTLEVGVAAGMVAMVVGLSALAASVLDWVAVGFGDLVYPQSMRRVIPGVTLTALGFQTVLFSFFLSILGLRRR